MASITLDLPDSQLARVENSVASVYGYDVRKLEGETKKEFLNRRLIGYLYKTLYLAEIGGEDKETQEAQIRSEVPITSR